MADVQSAAETLLKNPQFMDLFQRAAGGQDSLKDIPPEGDPRREKRLQEILQKIQEENRKAMTAKLEEIHSDENGQWMYILPEPGFCVKCTMAGGGKVFINVCRHERVAEPIPMDDPSDDTEIKVKVPLSCGQARAETDKSGKPCKVYDVIVNPSTIQRCNSEHEFRSFVISLCIHWIKQKSEPTLNAEEFRNMNFKAKGTLEPQRIRLSTIPKAANALGDEIKLPQNTSAGAVPTSRGGQSGGKLIEEVTKPTSDNTNTNRDAQRDIESKEQKEAAAAEVGKEKEKEEEEEKRPVLVRMQEEGSYNWSAHAKPMLNPYFRETVPASYTVEVHIPTISTIREVEVRLSPKCLELLYVDVADEEGASPFLSVPLNYPVDNESPEAKFVRKTHILRMRLTVRIPDETSDSGTRPERDAVEIEEEEMRAAQAQRERENQQHKERMDRMQQEEAHVMQERRTYVENLAAIQEGDIPPTLRDEMDKMPAEQLAVMLQRMESGSRKGDSIDTMLEKFPGAMIDAICRYIRKKLGLENRPAESKAAGAPPKQQAQQSQKSEVKKGEAPAAPAAQKDSSSDARVEYNFAKKAEALFGVAFQNRYLFALD